MATQDATEPSPDGAEPGATPAAAPAVAAAVAVAAAPAVAVAVAAAAEAAPAPAAEAAAEAEAEAVAEAAAAAAEARMRALSSPLRLRVLRLCAFDARTNKELAELLGVNPGTMLHHVRTLVQTGYLAAEPERSGAQGAREVPYRATGLSWRTPLRDGNLVLVETFLQQIEGLGDDQLNVSWMGLRLNAEHKTELERRLYGLMDEFRERGPDTDGESYSLFTALHTDRNPPSAR